MKRLLIIAAAVAVLGLGAVAVGGAATSAQEHDGPLGTFLARVADKLGVSEDELNAAIEEAGVETIDEALADGRITDDQADRLRERVEDGGFPFPPRPFGERHMKGPNFVVDAAVEVLDMSREDLLGQLKDGNSLADVAEAEGMSVEAFEAALLAEVKAQLDGLVSDGELTQDQADRIFQNIEENIDRIVNSEAGPCVPGGSRHGPGHFRGARSGGAQFGGAQFGEHDSAEEAEVTA